MCVFFYRCTRDGNTFWMSQNRSMSEFKVEAFRYLGAVRNAIYMECHVRMCTMDDMSSQCQFCDDKNVRSRRSADEEESKENVQTVKSPVFYIIERRKNILYLSKSRCLSKLKQSIFSGNTA